MRATRLSVRELILGDGKDPSLSEEVLKDLEPFLLRCEAGTYSVGPSGQTSHEQAAAVLNGVLAPHQARSIAFVDNEESIVGLPRWLARRAERRYRPDDQSEALTASIELPISDVLSGLFEAGLREKLGGPHMGTCSARLRESLGQDLLTACERTFGTELGSIAWRGLWPCLHFFLCAAIAGDARTVGVLRPLVLGLGASIPLGEKAGDPGTWIVLRSC